MNTIVLTGGGTAGHIIPNLALVPKLRTAFSRIVYIGSFDGIENKLLKQYPDIEFYPITTAKLIRKWTLKNLKIPFLLHKGTTQATKIIKKINPNVIFSKGGFVSLPVVLAGHKQKVPIVLHESDFSLGLANKLSTKKASCVLTTFPQTAEMLKNGVFVGAPVKQSLFTQNPSTIEKTLNISTTKPILLVIGGSLGAKAINDIIEKNIQQLTKLFFIIHITGTGKSTTIANKNYIQFPFYENIESLYAISDFAITRGGSNTIWELFSLQIPMLIIPLGKKISRGDQIQNALYFEKHGYALSLFEDELNTQNLLSSLNTLIKEKQKFKNNMKKNFNKNALDKIFEIICKYSKK